MGDRLDFYFTFLQHMYDGYLSWTVFTSELRDDWYLVFYLAHSRHSINTAWLVDSY